MRRLIFQLMFLVGCGIPGFSQVERQDSLVDQIAFYADFMVNAEDDQHRLLANQKFLDHLNVLLQMPGSFQVSLDSIPWISVLHGDGFRIITWQLRINSENYSYGGRMQWPDRIVELRDNRPWLNGSLRNVYTPDSWYGALYYKIIPFESGNKKTYLLFGFNAENSAINTKVADILDLSGETPSLGLPLFAGQDDPQTRLIFTYADAAPMQLVYDEQLNAIIHDHLEALPGIGPDGQTLAVPDGSQEGWFLREGKWIYEEKMFDIKSETPPMTDERKDRKEERDLFGRSKGN